MEGVAGFWKGVAGFLRGGLDGRGWVGGGGRGDVEELKRGGSG